MSKVPSLEEMGMSEADLYTGGAPDITQGDWLHVTAEWPTRDEVIKGYDEFWLKNQVKEFPKDKNGKNLRDEHGNILVIRTDIPRVRKKTDLYYRNRRTKHNNNNNNE
jgi:hypothetical protein